MKRSLVLVLALLAALILGVGPVAADGIIIIDPPPEPLPPDVSPWLTIRYHRVNVTIEDQIATTRIDQAFRNDTGLPAEGTYLFPLPPDAVVQRFVMWIDGEPVEGEILPADQARTIYEDYVRRNQDPALLEYVGRDAIRARIFPIPAGAERRIQIEYTQILPQENNRFHYRYPLNTERFSARPLEQLSIAVEITTRSPLQILYSPTHQNELIINRDGKNHATLSYEASNVRPDRDFELYVGFGKGEIGANLLTYRPAGEDGFFLLILSPDFEAGAQRILPKDLFLILDTSGSMEGEKLGQAKDALRYVLRHLNAEDRFNVIAFSSAAQTYAPALQPADRAAAAAEWVAGLEALGGTNIYEALSLALAQADPERPTVIIFLTDGLPTEGITEEQILLETLIRDAPESIRIFPFGVGYDVNTLFLDQLAQDHRGSPAYVDPAERIDEQVSAFYTRVQSPLLTDIALKFGEVTTYDVYPQPLPDLYAGTQLIITGRYTGSGTQVIRMTGRVDEKFQTFAYEETFNAKGGPDFIPRLWAARKIGYLLTQIRLHGEQPEWVDAVVKLSLRYGIITPYTSFLVQEEALTSTRRDEAAKDFGALPAVPPSGAQAVEDAELRAGLGGAEAPVQPGDYSSMGSGGGGTDGEPQQSLPPAPEARLLSAGDKTFLCTADRCTDTDFVPDQMQAQEVGFDTPAYWQMVAEHPEWLPYLSLASQVTFIAADGRAYTVLPGGPAEVDLPPPLPATEPAARIGTLEPSTAPSPAVPGGGGGLCGSVLLLLLAALGARLLGGFRPFS